MKDLLITYLSFSRFASYWQQPNDCYCAVWRRCDWRRCDWFWPTPRSVSFPVPSQLQSFPIGALLERLDLHMKGQDPADGRRGRKTPEIEMQSGGEVLQRHL